MYITEDLKKECGESFDWETYFTQENSDVMIRQADFSSLVYLLREHLKEDKLRMTLVMSKLLTSLLDDNPLKNPNILELGAATGFLTRWLINQYGGRGVLVDKSKASFNAYLKMQDDTMEYIKYINEDIFELSLEEKFDLVCSFGLIEHFIDKKTILAAHKKYTAPYGKIIILVPLDSPLTRTFLEIHPELNLGYRELLSVREFKGILKQNGLELIKSQTSWGYVYDFVGGICRVVEEENGK